MRFEPGQVFAGYTIVSRLGRGGMATVYLAREQGLDRHVALKVLPEHLCDEAEFAARFAQEARVIAALDHPNIIPLYRFGIEEELPWMALRYVDGGDLAACLGSGAASRDRVLSMLRAVASALDYAHARNVVHRDLKPANVLVTREGAAYLADFGIAKLLEGAVLHKSVTGSVIGTPQYMSPEQSQAQPLGPPTDVYSLAVICFQWLTGALPFDADTPMAVLLKHVQEPLPEALLRQVPDSVRAVLVAGLEKDATRRTPSAGRLIAELEQALAASAGDAPVPMPARAVRNSASVAPGRAIADAGNDAAVAVAVPEQGGDTNIAPSLLPEPRSYAGTAVVIGSVTALPFALLWSWLFATIQQQPLGSVLPFGLFAGLAFGVVFGLFMAVFMKGKTVTLDVPDRKRFVANLNVATSQLGFNPASQSEDFLTFKPSLQAGLASGRISVQLKEAKAVIVGSRMHVEKLVKRLGG